MVWGRFADARAVDLDAVERRANTRPFNCRGVLQDERAPCLGRKQRPGRPPAIIVASYHRYDIVEPQRIVVFAADVLVDVHAAQRRVPPYRSEQAGAPRLRRRQQLPPAAEQVGFSRIADGHRFDGVDAAFLERLSRVSLVSAIDVIQSVYWLVALACVSEDAQQYRVCEHR